MTSGPLLPNDQGLPPFRCPTSGVLLGVLVKSFHLGLPEVGGERAAKHLGSDPSRGRRARDYFAGKWVADEKRQEICRWVVVAARHSGLLDGLTLPPGEEPPRPDALVVGLASFLDEWLALWDAVYVQGSSGWPHPPQHLSGYVLGRQAVIDLALRTSALILLRGGCPPEAVQPAAATEHPGRSLIEGLVAESKCHFTREQLAREIGVEKSTVDGWIDRDSIPRAENIARLAEIFATELRPHTALHRWLRLQWGLIGIRGRLDKAVGSFWAIDLCTAMASFIQWTLGMLEVSKLGRDEFVLSQWYTLRRGLYDRKNYWILNGWLKIEDNELWTEEILVAQQHGTAARLQACFEVIGDWPRYTRQWNDDEARQSIPAEDRELRVIIAALRWMAPRTFQNKLYTTPRDLPPQAELEWLVHRAKDHMSQAEHHLALPLWTQVITADPDNADHRCHYGVSLWNARPQPDFDEAVRQLERACELRPDWDYPVAEIARVYLHRGWTDSAIQHLERAPPELIEGSQDCSFTLALALCRAGNFERARVAAQRACKLDPGHAAAWDLAAECAFQLGDKTDGGRCAREALRLGVSRSFDLWIRRLGN